MHRLTNPIMGYAWGSRTAIAELQGREPSAEPEAELWLGAHPKAPSRLEDGRTLTDRIATDPSAALGAHAGRELPFLLKVLAAETPLSLQAHPSFEQAREGYAKEEALSIPVDSPSRNYRDPNPKPELVCALSPFAALSGFRSRESALAVLRAFGLAEVAAELETAAHWPSALAQRVGAWLRPSANAEGGSTADHLAQLPKHLAAAAARFPGEARWTERLLQLHPGDAGVLVALLLHYQELAPGQALVLDAGNLHAYLHGTAIEIMANSDNVLRGGLTPKHIDIAELMRVLRFDAPAPAPLSPSLVQVGHERYETPFSQFELHRLSLAEAPITWPYPTSAIALVTHGTVTLTSASGELTLERGQSAFAAADELRWRASAIGGAAQLFVATTPAEHAS